MGPVTTVTALAKELGVTQPRVSQLKRESWFPAGPPWDVETVKLAIAQNARRANRKIPDAIPHKRPGAAVGAEAPQVRLSELASGDPAPGPAGSKPATPPAAPPAGRRSDVEILLDPDADAREVARAGLRVAAQAVAAAERNGNFGPREMAALRDALGESRRTEKALDELAQARGELISYSDAAGACGWFIALGLQALERVAGGLPSRIIQLADDGAWRAKPTAERVRELYNLIMREADAVRAATEADIRVRLVS